MRNDKKINKNRKILESWLEDIQTLESSLQTEKNDKKIAKLQKKLNYSKEMVDFTAQEIGKLGGNIDDILNGLSEYQKTLVLQLTPYGLQSEMTKDEQERLVLIKRYKRKIKEIQEAQQETPPYDSSAPIEQRMENKIYKLEKSLGTTLYLGSEVNTKTYNPIWNYLEHIDVSPEFTDEERLVMDRCYKIGQEYQEAGGSWLNRVAQSAIDFGSIVQSKMLCKKLYSDTFSKALRAFNPEKQYTAQQLEYEAKEMTKRSLYFFLNEDIRKPYVDKWQELYNDSRLDGLSEDKKLEIVSEAMDKAVGKELTLFTYLYTMVTTEQMMRTLNQIGQYTFEELGLN